MKLDIYSAPKFARSMAKERNLSMQFHDRNIAYTTKDTVFVPKPKYEWTRRQYIRWLKSIFHEIGHHAVGHKEIFRVMEDNKIDMASEEGLLLNVISDLDNEASDHGVFVGRDQILDEGSYIAHEENISNIKNGDHYNLRSLSVLQAGIGYSMKVAEKTKPLAASMFEEYRKVINEDAKEFLNKFLEREDIIEEIRSLKGEPEKQLDIARRLLKLITPEEEDKKEEEGNKDKSPERESAEGDKESEDGEQDKDTESGDEDDEGEDDDDGDDGGESGDDGKETGGDREDEGGDGEGEGGDGDGDGEGGDGDGEGAEEKEREIVKAAMKSMGIEMHAIPEIHDGKISIEVDKSTSSTYTPDTIDDFMTVHLKDDVAPKWASFSNYERDVCVKLQRPFIHRALSELSEVDMLKRNIAKYLKIYSRDKYRYGKRKGKVHSKNLSRIVSNDINTKNKIFKRKEKNDTLDTVITLLLDCSGSMLWDEKQANLIKAAYIFSQLLHSVHINYNIIGFSYKSIFSTKEENPLRLIFKTFNSPPISMEQLTEMAARSTIYHSNNADGENILYEYHELLKQKEKRKLLLVFSDGAPFSKKHGTYDFTKKVIQDIEKEGHAEIIGIGIKSPAVSNLYSDHIVINNSKEIAEKTLHLFKDRFIRRT